MNTISERIKFAMNARNMKQAELVRLTGISKGAFSSYLSGLYNPKLDKLELIADALNVNVNWLNGGNVPMQKSTTVQGDDTAEEQLPEYVFYRNTDTEYLLEHFGNVYLGLMNEYAALIPRFYVHVEPSLNEMHVLPLFFREDSKRFYQCPAELLKPEQHHIFTRDFETIQMVLTTSCIYYYGVNTETYKPEITLLSYCQDKGCYEDISGQGATLVPIEEFVKEIEKETLYLRQKYQ
ncbi:helix-turn-helix domain-containing protein [Lachnospiraceae bacterium 42-17]|jgi:transcriptional regulator with XRE-family HTH domain|nr:helix-turn-helix domain-containing protein [Oscillospiraceae bacterium]